MLDELRRAAAINAAVSCAVCNAPDDDGSVAYACESCQRVVCGLCVQDSTDTECVECQPPAHNHPPLTHSAAAAAMRKRGMR